MSQNNDYMIIFKEQCYICIQKMLQGNLVMIDVIILGYLGKGDLACGALGFVYYELFRSFLFATMKHHFNENISKYITMLILFIQFFLFFTIMMMLLSYSILSNIITFRSYNISKSYLFIILLIPVIVLQTYLHLLMAYIRNMNVNLPYSRILLICNIFKVGISYLFIVVCNLGLNGCALSNILNLLLMFYLTLRYIQRHNKQFSRYADSVIEQIKSIQLPIYSSKLSYLKMPEEDQTTDDMNLLTSSTSSSDDKISITMSEFMKFSILRLLEGIIYVSHKWYFLVLVLLVVAMGSIPFDVHVISLFFIQYLYHFLGSPLIVFLLSKYQIQSTAESLRWTIIKSSLYFTFFVLGVSLIFYLTSGIFGYIFTNDNDILFRLRLISPFTSCYLFAYFLYEYMKSLLNFISEEDKLLTLESIGLNLISLWFVGLIVPYLLCYIARPTFGLEGFWIGMISGLIFYSIAAMAFIWNSDWQVIVDNHRLETNDKDIDGNIFFEMVSSKAYMNTLAYEEVDQIDINYE